MAKKKTITHNNKTRRGNVAKIVDMYNDIFTLREKPVPMEIMHRLLDEALQDAVNDQTILKPSLYFRQKGIALYTIERWCKKYPEINDKYLEFKQACGDNREIGAIRNKLNASMVMFMMPAYDKEWRAEYDRREAAKRSESQGASSITVVMDNFGLKKEDDE